MKSTRTVRLISVLLVLLTVLASATPIFAYPSHTDYISDSADVLDDGTERSFKSTADTLRNERHVNLALCTVQSTGGEELADYASSLFVNWEIGHGMLLLIVTETGSFYAISSKSLEEYISYDKLGELLNTTMAASIEQADYSGAVSAASRALSDYISENVPKDFGIQKTYMPGWLKAVIIILVIIALLLIAGYVLLLYLERKKAERERMLREIRRRRLLNDPYRSERMSSGYRNPSNGAYRRDARRDIPRTPRQTQRTSGYYEAPSNRGARMPDRNNSYNTPHREAYSSARTNTRTPRDNSLDNAATVQISTADIRAARRGHSKFYDGTQ